MPIFHYKAVGVSGHYKRGVLHATSITDGYAQLKEQSLQAISLKEQYLLLRKTITIKDWQAICDRMHQLLSCLPLMDALMIFNEQEKKIHIQSFVLGAIHHLGRGEKLSSAFQNACPSLPTTLVALLQHAEHLGDYRGAFGKASDYFQWLSSVQDEYKSKMRYPFMVFITLICLIFIFAFTVAPALHPIFDQIESPSLVYRFLIMIHDFSPTSWIITATTLAGLWVIGKFFAPSLINILCNNNIIQKMLQKKQVLSFSKEMAVFLSSGLPLRESLILIKQHAQTLYFKSLMDQLIQSLERGSPLSEALIQTQSFPPLLIHLIKIGEKTASLENNFKLYADIAFKEYKEKIEKILSIIQPIALILIGGFMICLVLGLIAPLYDVIVKTS